MKPLFKRLLAERIALSFVFFVVFLVAQVFWAMTAPGVLAQNKTPAAAKQPIREIIAAVPRSWPPQYNVDENGKPVGFAIDVMEGIAALANVRVTYRVLDAFADVSDVMRKGEAHIIPNSGITADRATGYFFTEPVETFVVSIFVRRDTTDIKGREDLVGRRVAVVEHNISEKLLKPRKDIKSVVHRDAVTALFDLLSGDEDALVFPEPVMLHLARKAGVEDRIKLVGEPLKEIKRAIRVQRSEPELFAALNKAVKSFVGTPAYQRIYLKWYGKPQSFWTVTRVAWSMGGGLALILVLMAGWRHQTSLRLNRALRESEERLRTFVDNVPSLVSLKNLEGRYLLMNDEYTRQFGFSPQNDEGKITGTLFPRELAEKFTAQEREVVDTKGQVTQEHVIPYAEGDHILLCTKFPVLDFSGKISSIGTISTDITDLRKAEEGRRLALLEAEQANQAKSQFLAHMSHELRTPLNSVIGFSEVMAKEVFGPLGHVNYREYSKDIHASGTHLLNLLSDILDISKIEAGGMEIFEEDLDVSKIMTSAVRMVRNRSDKKKIKVSINLEDNLPRLRGDELRLKQVLLNLLSNAIKFTPPEGRVTVKANVDDENAMVWQVADTGIGIGAENLKRIMKPFEQVRECSTQAHEGTGLGLYLTSALTELHDGTLEIESEVGKGTTVTVRFPSERTI